MNYQVPEGFRLDPKTGQYRNDVKALDEAGNPCLVITWFDAEQGTYAQQVVPAVHRPEQAAAQQAKPAQSSGGNVPIKLIIIIASIVLGLSLIIGISVALVKNHNKSADAKSGTDTQETTEDGPQIVEDYVTNTQASDKDVPQIVDDTVESTSQDENGEQHDEESKQIASFLLGAQESTYFDVGEPVDYQGIILYDYSCDVYFDGDGNVTEINMDYLPALTPSGEMNFDAGTSQWEYHQNVETLDKWIEGEKTACVRAYTDGFTITFKLDYIEKKIYAYIEDRDSSADTSAYLNLIDGSEDTFATPEDVEKGRQILKDSGWNL